MSWYELAKEAMGVSRLTPEVQKRILDLYNIGLSTYEISSSLGLSRMSINNILSNHKVKKRTRDEAVRLRWKNPKMIQWAKDNARKRWDNVRMQQEGYDLDAIMQQEHGHEVSHIEHPVEEKPIQIDDAYEAEMKEILEEEARQRKMRGH